MKKLLTLLFILLGFGAFTFADTTITLSNIDTVDLSNWNYLNFSSSRLQIKSDLQELKNKLGINCELGYNSGIGWMSTEYIELGDDGIIYNVFDGVDEYREKKITKKAIDKNSSIYRFLSKYIGKYKYAKTRYDSRLLTDEQINSGVYGFILFNRDSDYNTTNHLFIINGQEYVFDNFDIFDSNDSYITFNYIKDDGLLYSCSLMNIWNNQGINQYKSDNEFVEALNWMYSSQLTKFNDIPQFNPKGNVTREQASKFFSQFALNVLKKNASSDSSECLFSDISSIDTTLQDYAKKSCNLGIFKGRNGQFKGKMNLTRAEAITALIRAISGKQDESNSIWYKNYYDLAFSKGLLRNLDYSDGGNQISRYEMSLLLYRASKYLSSQTTATNNLSTTSTGIQDISSDNFEYLLTEGENNLSTIIKSISFNLGKKYSFNINQDYDGGSSLEDINELKMFSKFKLDNSNNILFGSIPMEGSAQNMGTSLYYFDLNKLDFKLITSDYLNIQIFSLYGDLVYGLGHYHYGACEDVDYVFAINYKTNAKESIYGDSGDNIYKVVNSKFNKNYTVGRYSTPTADDSGNLSFTGTFRNIDDCNEGVEDISNDVYFKYNINKKKLSYSFDNNSWNDL